MSSGGGGKGGKRLPEEEHVNHERWLVTYADMITLLMVLFIVLFAMSTVDQRKFNALKQGLSAGFGAAPSITDGSQGVMAESGADGVLAAMAPSQVAAQTPAEKAAAAAAAAATDAAVTAHDQKQLQAQYAEATAEAKRLKDVSDRVLEQLKAKHLEKDIQVGIDDRGLVLSMVSRHVVFAPNMAELTDRGREVLDVLAPVLREVDSKLEIDGHTTQEKVKPMYFPTDWELSSARSITVLRHLNESGGVPNSLMTAAAFGHEKPLVDPADPDAQRVNKRVDIVVLSPLSAEARALLPIVFSKLPDSEGGES